MATNENSLTNAQSGQSRQPRAGIFISYRRADSSVWAGRLVGDLRAYFGANRVYFDLHSNRSGVDYRRQIVEALAASRIVLAIIGPGWLDPAADGSHGRIHEENDVVRQELEMALAQGIAMSTLLVGTAAVPLPDQLPASLRALAYIHALRLSDTDWDYDFGRILECLETHGITPTRVEPEGAKKAWEVTRTGRYQRTVRASRRRAFDAVMSAVEQLRYRNRQISLEAAQETFQVVSRKVCAKVIDAEPGYSTLIIEYPTIKTAHLVAGSVAAATLTSGLSFAVWPALRAWERGFAKGFFDNVEGVLGGTRRQP
jgi:hypothetical protein